MNWENLKNNKCPKCGSLLKQLENNHACTSECSFMIGKSKFDSIVNGMYAPKQKRCGTFDENGNLTDWNNFGHNKISEDFSDVRINI